MCVPKYLALLRAVNVGGKNKVPMKELRQELEAAGLKNVQTFIQSGNVVFEADAKIADSLPSLVAGVIKERFDVTSPVVIRTKDELATAIKQNPFLKEGEPQTTDHIDFLADEPTAAQIEALDPNRSPGDRFAVVGKEIYLRFSVGIGTSKLTNAYFDSKLKTVGTARNLRTTNTLLEMMSEG
jgi:uncharacterized protein (DUF1697 family)